MLLRCTAQKKLEAAGIKETSEINLQLIPT